MCELYSLKAQIYEYLGNPEQAAKLAEESRGLDTADRYLNNESCKFQLRINKFDRSIELFSMFNHDTLNGKDEPNIHELQCMWFELETAHARYREGNYRLCLKEVQYIEKHFD